MVDNPPKLLGLPLWKDVRLDIPHPEKRGIVAKVPQTNVCGSEVHIWRKGSMNRAVLQEILLIGVVLFATSGGSGLGNTAADLPGAEMRNGKLLKGRLSETELRQWVESL